MDDDIDMHAQKNKPSDNNLLLCVTIAWRSGCQLVSLRFITSCCVITYVLILLSYMECAHIMFITLYTFFAKSPVVHPQYGVRGVYLHMLFHFMTINNTFNYIITITLPYCKGSLMVQFDFGHVLLCVSLSEMDACDIRSIVLWWSAQCKWNLATKNLFWHLIIDLGSLMSLMSVMMMYMVLEWWCMVCR